MASRRELEDDNRREREESTRGVPQDKFDELIRLNDDAKIKAEEKRKPVEEKERQIRMELQTQQLQE